MPGKDLIEDMTISTSGKATTKPKKSSNGVGNEKVGMALALRAQTADREARDKAIIATKILAVMEEIGGYVQKKGDNLFQHYKYVQEADVMDKVGKALIKVGMVIMPSVLAAEATEHTIGNNKPFILSKCRVRYTFIDVATGASYPIIMEGQGGDPLDKGIYKAITGATKYALMKVFMLSSGDDPERDSAASEEVPEFKTKTWITGALMSVDAPTVAMKSWALTFQTAAGPTFRAICKEIPNGWTEDSLKGSIGVDVQYMYERRGGSQYLIGLQRLTSSDASSDIPTHISKETEIIDLDDNTHYGTIKSYDAVTPPGKIWTKYTFQIQEGTQVVWLSCFSLSELGDLDQDDVRQCVREGTDVVFTYEVDGKFKNIKTLWLGD